MEPIRSLFVVERGKRERRLTRRRRMRFAARPVASTPYGLTGFAPSLRNQPFGEPRTAFSCRVDSSLSLQHPPIPFCFTLSLSLHIVHGLTSNDWHVSSSLRNYAWIFVSLEGNVFPPVVSLGAIYITCERKHLAISFCKVINFTREKFATFQPFKWKIVIFWLSVCF